MSIKLDLEVRDIKTIALRFKDVLKIINRTNRIEAPKPTN